MATNRLKHQQTQASVTTTKEVAEPRHAPTPAQILDRQLADAKRAKAEREARVTTPPATTAVAVVESPEALQRHAAEWGSTPLTMMDFHGNDGIYRLVQDGGQVEPGTEFVAIWTETRKGFCNFSDDGYRQEMVGISEDRAEIQREDLGDDDQEQWPEGMDGQKRDPWQAQYILPLQRYDGSMELVGFVARNGVSINAVQGLIGRCRYHPRAQQGFFPLIKLGVGHYNNKRFGGVRPKPLLAMLTGCGATARRSRPPRRNCPPR